MTRNYRKHTRPIPDKFKVMRHDGKIDYTKTLKKVLIAHACLEKQLGLVPSETEDVKNHVALFTTDLIPTPADDMLQRLGGNLLISAQNSAGTA